jgi:hypothetical protein
MSISPVRVARLTVGQVSLTVGMLWLVLSLNTPNFRDAFAGLALAGGGLVMLLWRRIRLPVRLVAAVSLAAGVVGTAAGLAVRSVSTGGMFVWSEGRGWPFEWVGRGAVADDFDEARRQAIAESWGYDLFRLVVDVSLWAYAGLVSVVLIGLVTRRFRVRPA